MMPHQQRVIDEKADLDVRRAKLVAFFDTSVYKAIDVAEQARLNQQAQVMDLYSTILGQRIAAFTPPQSTPIPADPASTLFTQRSSLDGAEVLT